MSGKTLIIGAGSKVGRMLHAQWAGLPNLVWLSRNAPSGGWAAEDGPDRLRPFLHGVDVVLCLAGATPRGGVDFALNATIAEAVVLAAGPGRMVFLASTMAVYGGGAGPHAEDGPVAPADDYGVSKLQMELVAARVAAEMGTTLCALRFGNIVGADMLFENIVRGKAITLDRFADGCSPARSYLDPERLATALLGLIDRVRGGASVPEVLNLASDPPLDMAAMLRAAGVPFETRKAPEGARESISMDLARARALLPRLADPVEAEDAVAAWRRIEASV